MERDRLVSFAYVVQRAMITQLSADHAEGFLNHCVVRLEDPTGPTRSTSTLGDS